MGSLDVQVAELSRCADALTEDVGTLCAAHAAAGTDPQRTAHVVAQTINVLQSFADAAEAAGAQGLRQVFDWLLSNLAAIALYPKRLSDVQQQMLLKWPALVHAYLDGRGPKSTTASLTGFLQASCWTLRPSADGMQRLEASLSQYMDNTAWQFATDAVQTAVSQAEAAASAELSSAAPAQAEATEETRADAGTAAKENLDESPCCALPVVEPAAEPPSTALLEPDDPLPADSAPDLESALDRLSGQVLSLAAAGEGSADRRALQAVRGAVSTAIAAAESASNVVLLEALVRVGENVEALASAGTSFKPSTCLSLLDFPTLALESARRPDDPQIAEDLIANLCAADWPIRIADEEAAGVRALLVAHAAAGVPAAEPSAAGQSVDTRAASVTDVAPFAAVAERQQADPQHLAMFATELASFGQQLTPELERAAPGSDPATLRGQVELVGDLLKRIATTAQAIGLSVLGEVTGLVVDRVLMHADSGLAAQEVAWLDEFPRRVRAYLDAPTDPSTAAGLVEQLIDGGLRPALDQAAVADLELRLVAVDLVADTSAPARATDAAAEDISLAIPADINAELLDGLLAELPVQTAEFAAAMQRVASGRASPYDLEVAKRAAHTLKGAANTVGVRGIANLTHHLEDVLIALTREGIMPRGGLAEMLTNASDCLEAMSEAVLGVSPPPADSQQVLQQVLDWANRIDHEGISGEAAAVPSEVSARKAGAPPPMPASNEAQPAAAAVSGAALRVSASVVDELLRLGGETMIANAQIKEQFRQIVTHTRAVTTQNAALQALAGELEHLVDVRGVAATFQREQNRTGFDALEFEHYNELHTVTRRLIEASTDARELSSASEERLRALAELIESQGRLHRENQEVVMKTRMVPVTSIVSRLQRSVRQTCRLLDKRAELVIRGAETNVDGNVLNALVEPLMHLLRNAIDHGIEAPAQRTQLGKPAHGRIDLSVGREGASILVRVADDGAGLDVAAIRANAIARGLMSESAVLSNDDVARLILLPGLSTRAEATQVSGRGIGMDAVNAAVVGLNGSLRLHSEPGRGLTVEMRLPASLMTTHGLLVRYEGRVVVVSSNGVQDIRYVSNEQLETVGDAIVYRDRNQVFPLESFDRLVGHGGHGGPDKRGWFPALMVRTESGGTRAVAVHDVLDSRDLVVKDFGRYVARPAGVIGVTVLGDGSIAPVLDLPKMLSAPAGASTAPTPVRKRKETSRVEARLSALVVDDSLTARRVAAQLMRDAGFEVRTAIDGMEAAAIIDKKVPDIILVDMEMPRMNGLELTTHVRSRDATRAIPVIMITSRATEKHRRQAEIAGVNVYLTKPFANELLLGHVERLTRTAAASAMPSAEAMIE